MERKASVKPADRASMYASRLKFTWKQSIILSSQFNSKI